MNFEGNYGVNLFKLDLRNNHFPYAYFSEGVLVEQSFNKKCYENLPLSQPQKIVSGPQMAKTLHTKAAENAFYGILTVS